MRMQTLDPSLSVYDLVRRTQQQKTVLADTRTMRIVSHEIENTVILDHTPARIFSGFQRMSAFYPQVERYQQLAAHAESVHIFAHFDVPPPPMTKVKFFPLMPEARLTNEWFVVAASDDFFTALVTEERYGHEQGDERMFEGVWSFDEEMVSIIQAWLSHLVGARPIAEDRTRNYKHHSNLMANILNRMTIRVNAGTPQRIKGRTSSTDDDTQSGLKAVQRS